MSQTDYQADRSDMVAYMTEADENGEWTPPSRHHVDNATAAAIRANRPTHVLFRLRFKLDTRSNAREGWFTAQEVAEFLNPKMDESKDGERFGVVRDRPRGLQWKDGQYDWKMQVGFRQISELSP